MNNIIKKVFLVLQYKNIFGRMNDEKYLKWRYKLFLGQELDLKNPKTFNGKLQWLKLHARKPEYTTMVDKIAVKDYVAKKIGEEYIIPTIGVYEKFDDIDFNELPKQFVMKCNHDSGGLIICKDKTKLDIKAAKKKINKSLKRNYYYAGREWPYKNVKPRIIIEKYIENKNKDTLCDYKFFCFNGEPKIVYISDNSHQSNQHIAFFDMDFKQLPIKRKDYLDFDEIPQKPEKWEQMKKFASILSKNIPHVRVDFYEVDRKQLYFGELTFYTGSGFIPWENEKYDKLLGDMIDLSLVKDNNAK